MLGPDAEGAQDRVRRGHQGRPLPCAEDKEKETVQTSVKEEYNMGLEKIQWIIKSDKNLLGEIVMIHFPSNRLLTTNSQF